MNFSSAFRCVDYETAIPDQSNDMEFEDMADPFRETNAGQSAPFDISSTDFLQLVSDVEEEESHSAVSQGGQEESLFLCCYAEAHHPPSDPIVHFNAHPPEEQTMYPCPRTTQVTPPLPTTTCPNILFRLHAREYERLTTCREKRSTAKSCMPAKRSSAKMRQSRKKRHRDPNLPKRPLSAYNIFYKQERALINGETSPKTGKTPENLKKHRRLNPTRKLGFANLTREIGERWKEVKESDPARYAECAALAAIEKEYYDVKKASYEAKQRRS